MSFITDLVFISPTLEGSILFANLFEQSTTERRYADGCLHEQTGSFTEPWRPEPLDHNFATGKCPGSYVYYLGVNYLSWELVDDIRARTWAVGTVLYLWSEAWDDPKVTTW